MPQPCEDIAQLRQLIDERAVLQVVTRLARAQDDRDFVAYRDCLDEQVLMNQPMVQGPGAQGRKPIPIAADTWCRTVATIFARFDATQHQLSNHLIEVNGQSARCRMDVTAAHIVRDATQARECVVCGRYDMRLVRRDDGKWRITERILERHFLTGDVSMATLFLPSEK
jgi:hypothetical protein